MMPRTALRWELGLGGEAARGSKALCFSGPHGSCSTQIWFNNKGWHAMVAFVNRANNGLLHALLPSATARRAHSITTLNHPLNLTKEQLSEAAL